MTTRDVLADRQAARPAGGGALVSIADTARRLAGARRSSVYRWIARGLLPPPVRIGIARVGIPADELVAVIAARTRGAGDDDVRALVRELVARRGAA